jgi:hypothetical protein
MIDEGANIFENHKVPFETDPNQIEVVAASE